MSHSKKDGKRKGGHRNYQGKEVWSRRCKKVNMWDTDNQGYKKITHRYERRVARRQIKQELEEND